MDGNFVCGAIEELCSKKFYEAWNDGTKLGKVKAFGYGLLRGVPSGLVICGVQLFAVGIACAVQGKKLGMVDKD